MWALMFTGCEAFSKVANWALVSQLKWGIIILPLLEGCEDLMKWPFLSHLPVSLFSWHWPTLNCWTLLLVCLPTLDCQFLERRLFCLVQPGNSTPRTMSITGQELRNVCWVNKRRTAISLWNTLYICHISCSGLWEQGVNFLYIISSIQIDRHSIYLPGFHTYLGLTNACRINIMKMKLTIIIRSIRLLQQCNVLWIIYLGGRHYRMEPAMGSNLHSANSSFNFEPQSLVKWGY